MTEPSWPEWGADLPPQPAYAKAYRTGQAGDMHAGEILDTVHGPDLSQPGQQRAYEIIRCSSCIGIHAFPLPSAEQLARYYAETFYEHEKPDMISRYLADAAWWGKCMHGPLLDGMAAALHEQGDAQVYILDVGAGPGLLLREAQRRGWNTTALEPSPLCGERLHHAGHALIRAPLADVAIDLRRVSVYDMVTLWETLEHVPCPEETLLQVYDLLRPGGVLGICVPNEYTPAQYAACERFGLAHWWLAPPQHLWYWTPKTLQLLLRRCGFALVDSWATFPMIEHFMLEKGSCYVGNDTLGRACHRERMRAELLMASERDRWGLSMAMRRANVARRRGRELVVIARKES